MNYFTLVAGLLYIGAGITEFSRGNYLLFGLYLSYATANACLGFIK